MPIHSIAYNGIDPRFPVVFNSANVSFDTGTWGLAGTDEEICNQLKVLGQQLADVVTPLANLPIDDPYRIANPNTPCAFWDALEENLIIRTVLVDKVWKDEVSNRFLCRLVEVLP